MTKKVLMTGVLSLFFMPIVSLAVLYWTGSFETKDLPILGEVPEFDLKERSGEFLTTESLKHKVWIANFVFTRCTEQCPLIVNSVQKVQRALRFKEKFQIVSITMDPDRDTPQALAAYAVKIGADPFKWLFATGKYSDIQTLVKKGFKLATVEGRDEGDFVTHSSKLVLVDGNSRIRGYYDANEDSSVRSLIKDTRKLLRANF